MKLNYLIKAIPFLINIIINNFLFISNQKENTKLRILIWNTPSLIIRYISCNINRNRFYTFLFITTNLAKINHQKLIKKINKYKKKNKMKKHNEYIDNNKTII